MESTRPNNRNKAQQWFYRLTLSTLIGLILVFLAGSLVKATDSGMGCPDWPKCFGHFVPPMDTNEVYFKGNNPYFKGQMIIENNSLWSAKKEFISNSQFQSDNWELFETHDYATYNPIHTLIEYLNRLVSVLLGFTALGMLIASFSYWKHHKMIPILSLVVIILIGFEAWLGRLVVDSVLAPRIITLHLFAGYALILITSIQLAKIAPLDLGTVSRKAKIYFSVAFGLLIIQLLLGTQLRELFDELYKNTEADRSNWISIANLKFLVHRSFSLVYALFLILSAKQLRSNLRSSQLLKKCSYLIIAGILMEILSGVLMEHLNIPRFAQPIHVLVSSVLFASHTFGLFLLFRKQG